MSIAQALAADMVSSQRYATLEDYGGDVDSYVGDLLSWAEGEGWMRHTDRSELDRWLRYYIGEED